MATKLVQDSSLTAVANAIRSKTGGSELLEFPNDFVTGIGSIGSSDFSTAQVTIVSGSSDERAQSTNVVIIADYNGYNYISPYWIGGNSPGVYTFVLYNGEQPLFMDPESVESVSGSIYLDTDKNTYVITGDCTITLYDLTLM